MNRGSFLGLGAYVAVKIARGELFEAIDALEFVRARVLGPLILSRGGRTAEWCPPRRAGCPGARGRLALDPGFARPAILLGGH